MAAMMVTWIDAHILNDQPMLERLNGLSDDLHSPPIRRHLGAEGSCTPTLRPGVKLVGLESVKAPRAARKPVGHRAADGSEWAVLPIRLAARRYALDRAVSGYAVVWTA